MKLIIQIPCYNEEKTLPETLCSLPRTIQGLDCVEWLVIDDGSQDKTAEIAHAHNVDHIIRLPKNKGLANAFLVGLENCIRLDADIIVNTDGDNQYCADDIPKLIKPILDGKAHMVIGTRPIQEIEHFSYLKKKLQKLGSMIVRMVSNSDILDAPSGFRAFNRDAAIQLNVFNKYTYTLETIIQAGQKGLSIASVPIRVNQQLRSSRLIKNVPIYIGKSIITILRIFITYRPFRFFCLTGILVSLPGFLLGIRFLFAYFSGHGKGMMQSLILCGILIGIGFAFCVLGILSDLIAVNRQLLEKNKQKLFHLEELLKRNTERSSQK